MSERSSAICSPDKSMTLISLRLRDHVIEDARRYERYDHP
jgi:hypothetical protein